MKKLYCGHIRKALIMLFTAVCTVSMALPAATVSAEPAEAWEVSEDFSWVSFENMLQSGAYTLTSADNVIGSVSDSAALLLSKGTGSAVFDVSFAKMNGTENAYFDFGYAQVEGGSFSFGLSGAGEEVVAVSQAADGSLSLNGTTLVNCLNTKIAVRLALNFSQNKAVVNVYNEAGTRLKYQTVNANLENGVDKFFVALGADALSSSGISMNYLYGWRGNGTEREAQVDENPVGEIYKTIYEDNFGYTSEEELADAGYGFTGSAADGELTVEDGYPKISRLTANGSTVTLNMPVPSEEETGYKLDGKIRASLTYQLPTNQIMRVYQKWKSVDVDENITATELTDGIMKRTRLYLRTDTGTEWRVHTSDNNGGIRPLVMELDFDNKIANAEMRISGAANPTSSKDMRTETEYNSNLYALDIELRGGSNGAIGNYLKVTTWKIEKNLDIQKILTEAVSAVDLSAVTDDFSAITENLSLPTAVGNASITWKSMNPSVISDSGTVMRPFGSDVSTELIMSVAVEGAVMNKVIPVTVKQGIVNVSSVTLNGNECTAQINTDVNGKIEAWVIFGQYRDKTMIKCELRQITFNDVDEKNITFTALQTEPGDLLKVFVWQDFSTLKPLSNYDDFTVQ